MDNQRLAKLGGVLTEKQWSGKVDTKKKPPEDLFVKGTKAEIVKWLKSSHKDLRGAMSALNFYINRAGSNLDPKRKGELEAAKDDLRKAFSVSEHFDMPLIRKIAGLPPITEMDDSEADAPPSKEEGEELASIVTKIAAKAEGMKGEELANLIQQVYDAGFKDGEKAQEEIPQGEEEVTEAAGEFVVYHDDGKKYPIKKRVATLATAQKHAEAMGKEYKTASFEYWSDKLNPRKDVKEAARKDLAAKKAAKTMAASIDAAPTAKPGKHLISSIGIDKEDDAGWMAVELAKNGMTVDMEEAMGIFYFNFKNKADANKAAALAQKLEIALV